MMQYDLIIIGSGPGGYVSAIRAGQTGLKTLVIDKKYIGGMCLNWGCIPTKSLIESAKTSRKVMTAMDFGITGIDPEKVGFDWAKAVGRTETVVKRLTKGIEYLWKKNGVDFILGEAKITGQNEVTVNNQVITAKNIIIATGSKPMPIELPERPVELEELLSQPELAQKPVLYGRGAITVEIAQLFKLLGREPIIVTDDEPLIPGLDDALNSWILKKLKKDKIQVLPQSEVSYKDGKMQYKGDILVYDAVINTSLRRAILPSCYTDIATHNGYISTDENFMTSIPNVYAIGDVNGRSYLAHAASAQGLKVVDWLHGNQREYDDKKIPINIYSQPEMAQIGITEQAAKQTGTEYQIKEYPLTANGKALAEGNTEGMIRMIFEPKYKQVIGMQIIAENATDMIAEAGVMMELEGTIYDLSNTIHAHPTVSEVFMEVGSAALEE